MSSALTGLTNGAQYHVEVRAGNAVTWGAAASAIVRPFLPPAAPTLTATAGRGQAALSWTLTDSRISSWQYRQKLSTDSTWGAWTLISRTPSDRSYTVTNLTDGLTYDFQVRARMARGAGAASATVSVKPLPAQAPAKAAGLTASPGNAQVALDWKAERDDTITKWRLRVSPASAADVVIGTGSSQEITLTWTDPSNSAITGWRYSTDGSNWTNIDGSTATTTSHTFTATLTSGTAHTYQVEGVVAGQTNVTPTGLQAWSAFTDAGTLVTGPAVAPITALTFTSDNWNTVQTINVKLASQPSEMVKVYMEELARVGSSPALYSPDTLTFTTDDWNTTQPVQVRLKHLVTSGRSAAVSFAGHALGATPMRHGHTAGGLTNGTAYTFRVLAVNARADGAASDSVTATPVNSPAAPTGFTAAGSTSGSAQVVLAWTDPGDDSITSWEYRRKSGITGEYGAWTAVPSSDKDTTTYTVTGLTHNALYRFQIRAVNATGNGNPSAALWARPVSAEPAAPTGLKATSGNARVQLTWSAKTNIHIDEFEYRRSTDGGTTWSAWTDVPGGGAARQVTVTGLDNGKVHTFKVRAVNTAGNAESGTASAPTRPLAPSSFSATGGDATVTLTWTKSASDDTTLLRWEYRRKVGAGHYGGWTPIPGATGATRSHTFTSMDNGTAYTYKLRAVNAAGAGAESAERVANPALAVPLKPTGFQAHAGPASVMLQWDDLGNASISKWQYQQDGGTWKDVCVTSGDSSCPSKTSHKVTGLTNGTSYGFKVRAVNSAGNGTASDSASATPLAVPGQPTAFTATGSSGQVALAWTAPSGTITSWQYRQRTPNDTWGGWTAIPNSGASTTSHTVTNLTNNQPYQFQVRARNASGDGTPTAAVEATPVTAAPAASSFLSASGGDGRVRLYWVASAGAWVSGWEYRYKTTGTYGSWTAVGELERRHHPRHVVSVPNGKTYTFQVRPVNDAGDADASPEASASTLPLAPSSFAVTPGDRSMTLTWARGSGDTAVSAWQYQYTSDTESRGWTTVPGSTRTTTSYGVSGLTNGTTYTFKLRGVSRAGNGPASSGASASPTVQRPAKPTGLAAVIGNTQVTLSWDDPRNDRITEWEYSSDDGATWTDVPNSGSSTTTHTVPNLTNGTAYTFRVRAVTTAGEGPPSDGVTATPKAVPGAPASLAATAAGVGSGEIKLTWTAQSAATGWQYRYKSVGGYGSWTNVPCASPCTNGTLAEHKITGLSNNTLHTFQVRARNDIGWGPPSTATGRPVAGLPDRPINFKAVGGDQRVALTWATPNAVWIDGWQYSKDNGTSWSDIGGSYRATRGATITGLTNGTSHTWKVRAVNGRGAGPASDAVTEPTLPLAPTSLTADGGVGDMDLAWAKSSSDTTVTGWQYRHKTGAQNAAYGAWTSVPGGTGSTTSYTVTGLEGSTTYTFQLRAVNAAGGGAARTADSDHTAPAKPTGLTAAAGFERVTLSWTNPAGGGDLTGTEYRYQPKSSTDSGWTDWTATSAVAASQVVTGLSNGVRYTFEVRAVNASGDGAASDRATARPFPAKPANLEAAPGDKLVVLSWDDPDNPDIQRYEYQRKTGGNWGNTWTRMTGSDASTTRYVVKPLVNGMAYTFRVRAVSSGNGGTVSSEVTATPQPLPAIPPNVSATAEDVSKITLRWSWSNESLISKFQARHRAGSGAWSAWADVTKTLRKYEVTSGLTRGTVYTLEVRAVNNQAEAGPAGQAKTATAPAKPTGLTAAEGHRQVVLTWDDPGYPSITHWEYRQAKPVGGLTAFGDKASVELSWSSPADTSTIAKWQYRHKSSGDWTNVTWTDVTSSGPDTTSATVGSLTNNTAYTFQVRAVNASDALVGSVLGDAEATPKASPWTRINGSGASTVSHTVPNLTSDTAYAFQVRAVNAAGDGLASGIADATPPSKVGAPASVTLDEKFEKGAGYGSFTLTVNWTRSADTTIDRYQYRQTEPVGGLTAFGGDKSAELSWSEPADKTGITKWQYRHKSGGGDYPATWTDVTPSSATTTSATVGSLTNDTAYTFQVRAVTPSNALVGAVLGDAAATPSASAGWTNVPGSGAATKSYKLPRAFTSEEHWAVQVRAVNEAGTGPASDVARVTLALGQPTLTLTKTFPSSLGFNIAMTWPKFQRNGGDDPSVRYWQYRGAYGGHDESDADLTKKLGDWKTIPNSETTTSLTFTQESSQKYALQVRAINVAGHSPPSDVKFVTLTPDEPAGFEVTYTAPTEGERTGGTATLGWTAVGSTTPNGKSIQRYEYREKATGDWKRIPCTGSCTPQTPEPYAVTLKRGTTYAFELRAVNIAGAGPAATASKIKTGDDEEISQLIAAPDAPANFAVVSGSQRGEAILLWTKPDDVSGITGWQFRQIDRPPLAVGTYEVVSAETTDDDRIHITDEPSAGTFEWSGTAPTATDPGKLHIGALSGGTRPVTISADGEGYALLKKLVDGGAVRIGSWRATVSGAPTFTADTNDATRGTAAFDATSVSGSPPASGSAIDVKVTLSGEHRVTLTATGDGFGVLKKHLAAGREVRIGSWDVSVVGPPTFPADATATKGAVAFYGRTLSGEEPDTGGNVAVSLLNGAGWSLWDDGKMLDTAIDKTGIDNGNAYGYTVSGLIEGATYSFQMRAYHDTAGAGAHSGVASYTTRAVLVSVTEMTLRSGQSEDYTLALSSQPTADVTITITVDGNTSVTIDSEADDEDDGRHPTHVHGHQLEHPQTVTVTAGGSSTTIKHAATQRRRPLRRNQHRRREGDDPASAAAARERDDHPAPAARAAARAHGAGGRQRRRGHDGGRRVRRRRPVRRRRVVARGRRRGALQHRGRRARLPRAARPRRAARHRRGVAGRQRLRRDRAGDGGAAHGRPRCARHRHRRRGGGARRGRGPLPRAADGRAAARLRAQRRRAHRLLRPVRPTPRPPRRGVPRRRGAVVDAGARPRVEVRPVHPRRPRAGRERRVQRAPRRRLRLDAADRDALRRPRAPRHRGDGRGVGEGGRGPPRRRDLRPQRRRPPGGRAVAAVGRRRGAVRHPRRRAPLRRAARLRVARRRRCRQPPPPHRPGDGGREAGIARRRGAGHRPRGAAAGRARLQRRSGRARLQAGDVHRHARRTARGDERVLLRSGRVDDGGRRVGAVHPGRARPGGEHRLHGQLPRRLRPHPAPPRPLPVAVAPSGHSPPRSPRGESAPGRPLPSAARLGLDSSFRWNDGGGAGRRRGRAPVPSPVRGRGLG